MSIFQNIQYLFLLTKNVHLDINVSRIWPWLLWYLWKNRNSFLFEGKTWEPAETMSKVREEANSWFLAQQVERLMEKEEINVTEETYVPIHLPKEWTHCEIGMEWDKLSGVTGASWIARDSKGTVLQHSRISLVGAVSKVEARLQALLWAFESMHSLKYSKVVFMATCQEEFEAVLKPNLWPAMRFEVEEIRERLKVFSEWKLRFVPKGMLRCAYFIAQSVLSVGFTQSYVAAGHPRWLDAFFVSETGASSL